MSSYNHWDFILIAVVTLQATVIAYIYRPALKAFVSVLPVPIGFTVMAVGQPIDATNIIGLLLLWSYLHGIRLLRNRAGIPIVPSILIATVLYCVVGTQLAKVIPRDGHAFFLAVAIVVSMALIALLRSSPLEETGHRTPLPLHIKLPMIALIVLALVSIKSLLHGFLTAAPMVLLISAYESRHSLGTLCRFTPVLMLFVIPIMVISRLSGPKVGLGCSLLLGWCFTAILLISYAIYLVRKHGRQGDAMTSLEEKLENVPEII